MTQAVLQAFPADVPERGVEVVAVGSDKADAPVLKRAAAAGVETFVCRPGDFADRGAWNAELRRQVAAYRPDWIVSAGFMRILGQEFVDAFPNRIINTHPALLPAFPGAHGVRDAMDYGAKVTGSTIHLVDCGVDTGPIIAQFPLAILPEDTEASLHGRIKAVEQRELVALLDFLATGTLTLTGRQVTGYAPQARTQDVPEAQNETAPA